ncbi:MAG: hypothetical protein IT437_14410 [Phycisphaerales bacterium]|nr:hypothetical protein [Phycisphaerales bacterium]
MLAIIVSIGGISSRAPGQVVIGPQVRVDNGNTRSGVEPTIAFVRDVSTMEAVAAAIDWRETGQAPRIGFGVTFDGGLTWEEGVAHAATDSWELEFGVDPHAYADPATGTIWLVATGGDIEDTFHRNRLLGLKRAQGEHAASVLPFGLLSDGDATVHRPVMTGGPAPGNPQQRNLYILYSQIFDTPGAPFAPAGGVCASTHMMLRRSTDGGQTWQQRYVSPFPYSTIPGNPPPCQFSANAAAVLVADREPQSGLVIAVLDTTGYDLLYSADAGDTWPALEDRVEFLPINLQPTYTPNVFPGDYRVPFQNSADLDPTTGDFYIVSSARREPGSPNLDLYVIRGHTVSGSPPIALDPPVRLELDGGAITAEGPDQLMPSLAMDGLGGINLVYYDTRNRLVPDSYPSGFLDAYYTRITGFGTPQQAVLAPQRLTPVTFCTDCTECDFRPCPYEDPGLPPQFMGDYIDIDAAYCEAYVTYASTETGTRHYYVRHINLCPDSDHNMMVNAMDVGTFQSLFAAGGPRADFNRDGVVSVADYSAFSSSYASWVP